MKRRLNLAFERSGRAILLAVPVTLLAVYAVAFTPSSPRVSRTVIASIQQPKLTIVDQANSPLRISVIKKDWTMSPPEVELTIENAAAQPIRAYAIRYEIFAGDSKLGGGTNLSNSLSIDSTLNPGHIEPTSISANSMQSEGVDNIKVYVDFVEFIDGTVWGADTNKSRERLIGMRAGARAATRHLLILLKKSGLQAVVQALEDDKLDLNPKSKHSPEWMYGFRSGIAHIKRRLKDKYSKSGVAEIEADLRRPFDASDRRQ